MQDHNPQQLRPEQAAKEMKRVLTTYADTHCISRHQLRGTVYVLLQQATPFDLAKLHQLLYNY
jgi:hypothetical protein